MIFFNICGTLLPRNALQGGGGGGGVIISHYTLFDSNGVDMEHSVGLIWLAR